MTTDVGSPEHISGRASPLIGGAWHDHAKSSFAHAQSGVGATISWPASSQSSAGPGSGPGGGGGSSPPTATHMYAVPTRTASVPSQHGTPPIGPGAVHGATSGSPQGSPPSGMHWRAGGGGKAAGGGGAIGSPGAEPSEKGEHLSGSDLPSLSRILTFRAPTAQVVVSMLYALRLQLRKPGGGPSPNVPAQMSLIR